MSRLVLTQDALLALIAQAQAAGNAELVAQLEATIANAKTLKNPNSIDDWQDATEAARDGMLTIRKDAIRDAAQLLYTLANQQPEMRDSALQLFSRAMRSNGDAGTDANGTDAETDAGTDAETDAGTDAETDAGTDAE